ncbi:hypothetical protein [Dickeya zeae]|uniref:Uncharacterized protein n=1 Tax=Dickeya zeae TaxID=204042 RepID=A0ABX8VSY6_9GAMM|nr:hypothetical protein [Dickeya zeae]QYM91004.1 hypothetical protein FGI21_03535 [Dickeya zeae]
MTFNVINEQKQKISCLYEKYCNSLKRYLDDECDFDVVHDIGSKFFEYVEQCSAHNNSINEIKESDWNQWFAETCIEVLALIKDHYIKYRVIMNDDSLKPSYTAFACMQRMAMDFDKNKAKEIKKLFKENNLPTYGFDKKRKRYMTKNHEKIAAFIFGVIFIAVMLMVSICIPNPTHSQSITFRTILSIAASGVATFFPGFIEVEISKWLRAGGAIAIFAVVYNILPAT